MKALRKLLSNALGGGMGAVSNIPAIFGHDVPKWEDNPNLRPNPEMARAFNKASAPGRAIASIEQGVIDGLRGERPWWLTRQPVPNKFNLPLPPQTARPLQPFLQPRDRIGR